MRVADARQVKLIWQARTKTDPIDARKLAELLRVNLFPTIWIPDADTRRRRQLLHTRAFLVQQRTRIKNRIHGRLTAVNLLFPRSPSTRSSGGRTSHGRTGRWSNRWLKWILVEITQTLKQSPGPVGDQYRRLLKAKGKSKATTAAARKLACYIYWMWRSGSSYEEWLEQRQPAVWSEVRPIQRMGAMAS